MAKVGAFVIIEINNKKLKEFCQRWKIVELSLFGSVLRSDFNADSDIDALVLFSEDADYSLLELSQMEFELSDIFGRKTELITKRGIERSQNLTRKNRILKSAKVIYEPEAA